MLRSSPANFFNSKQIPATSTECSHSKVRDNTIDIRCETNTDSMVSHWCMISEVKLKKK